MANQKMFYPDTIIIGDTHTLTGIGLSNLVFGRLNNVISGTTDSIVLGISNLISGSIGVAIGSSNTMYTATYANHFGNNNYSQSGSHSTLVGRANVSLYGGDNYAFGYANGVADLGSIAIGGTNAANGHYNMCLGHNNASGGGSGNTRLYLLGKSNTINGTDNIAIGFENTNDIATSLGVHQIGLGYQAYMRQYGEVVHAAGKFSANGDAQTSQLVARKSTTDDTVTEIALDGGTTYLSTEDNTAYSYVVTVTAKKVGALDHAMYRFEWSTVRGAGVGTVTVDGLVKTVIFETDSTWDVNVTADLTNGRPAIKVTGVAATTIRWVAKIEITEVA